MTDPTKAPDDAADRGLAAEVSGISDEQWLAGHRALLNSGDIPAEELGYLYDPGRDPATVTTADLTPDPDPAEPDHG
jgi:hypothetical protein